MKLIRTIDGIIDIDPQLCEPGYVWGRRWNKNAQEWGLCMLWKVDKFELVKESEFGLTSVRE